MTYMLLVVEKVGDREARTEDEGRVLYDRMLRFSEDLKQRGLLTLSQSLKTDAAGVRVTNRDRKIVVRDGPFVEAREMIGGFFLLTCDTREEAVAIARDCPAAQWATIEVRELGPCFQ
ncbi:MAG TPA: YciI family protein [Steroidobacteraceae bacterium]|nr:YciI family protein [Steroidobacteraceae bacterium]